MEVRTIPEGLEVFREHDAIVVRRRWSKMAAFWIMPGLAAALFPYFMFGTRRSEDWISLILTQVAPALGGIYFALCSLFNRTDVIISGSMVRAVSSPMPWKGDHTVLARDVAALFVRKRSQDEAGELFCVMYINRLGDEKELVRGGKGREQADFIASAVGEILGIDVRDEPKKKGYFGFGRKSKEAAAASPSH